MEVKILSLNIFRYYQDWELRKSRIIKFIKEINPDLIVLQECFDDSRHNKSGNNQGVQLNKELFFKNCLYSIAEKLESEGGKPIVAPVYDGLCVLTDLPIVYNQDIKLAKADDDKHTRIIQKVVLSKEGEKFMIFHTHFSNRDDFAKDHLQEAVNLAKQEEFLPIILGDLNIKIQDDVMEVGGEDFNISWFFKKYISYPLKEETLDYVLLPKKDFKFETISLSGEDLSDHRALVVKICNI